MPTPDPASQIDKIDAAIASLERPTAPRDTLDPAWQLVDLLQSVRAIAQNLVNEMRAAKAAGRLSLRDTVRASVTLQKSVDQAALLTGKISSGSQAQILVMLGASNMTELEDAMAMKRAGKDITLEAAFWDALDLVKMGLQEHPEWRSRALEAAGVKNALETNGYHA